MSKTGRVNRRRELRGRNRPGRPERRITVRGVQRNPPDLRKLSRAVIALALAEADAEAKTKAVDEAPGDAKPEIEGTDDGA